PREARQTQQRAHAVSVRHELAQQVAFEARGGGAGDTLFGERAPDVQQPSVLHARRTGALAGAAGQTAVQMQLGARADRRPLEQLLHQVDAAARAVELIAEQLVGRTGRETETAVHAGAQNRLRFAPLRGVPDEIGERGPHNFPAVAHPACLRADCKLNSPGAGRGPVAQPMSALNRCEREPSPSSPERFRSACASSACNGRLSRNPCASWQSCSCRKASCGKFSTPSAVTLMCSERDMAMMAAAIARSSLPSLMMLVTNERAIFSRSIARWRSRPKRE